jgi:hypothetical protein
VGELLRWQSDGGPVVVEVSEQDVGFQGVARSGEIIHDARVRFEEALASVRDAAVTALRTFRDEALKPDTVDIEFGVKFSAAAGAVIAQTAAEGHLAVRLRWSSGNDGQ